MRLEHFLFYTQGTDQRLSEKRIQQHIGKGIIMKNLSALLTICLLTLSISACIRPPAPVADAQAAYCEDLKTYQQAIEDVHNLPDTATVDEFQTAMKKVEDAHKELENSAWRAADSQTAALNAQYDEIRKNVDTIDNDTSLAEARTVISDSVASFKSTFDEVVRTSCKTS